MNLPTVSVIIRTTHRPTLWAAMQSVTRQTYAPLEIVLVDAVGTGFPTPISDAGGIAIVTHSMGKALGYGDAANAGLDIAQGDYIVFLDDDDFFDAQHIACRLEALNQVEAIDGNKPLLAYGPTRHVDKQGFEKGVMAEEYSPIRLHHHNYIQIGAALFSRQLLETGCRFDGRFAGLVDWDFWLQAAVHTSFAYTPHVTNNWCADGGESGAGIGENFDAAKFHQLHQDLKAKWRVRYEQLLSAFEQCSTSAFAALQRGDLAEAERNYRQAARLDATDGPLLGNLAFIRVQQGQFRAATVLLNRAIQYHPEYADARINLAMLYAQTGNVPGAVQVVNALLAADPTHSQALALRVRLAAALRKE